MTEEIKSAPIELGGLTPPPPDVLGSQESTLELPLSPIELPELQDNWSFPQHWNYRTGIYPLLSFMPPITPRETQLQQIGIPTRWPNARLLPTNLWNQHTPISERYLETLLRRKLFDDREIVPVQEVKAPSVLYDEFLESEYGLWSPKYLDTPLPSLNPEVHYIGGDPIFPLYSSEKKLG